jgi:hypothetical protein
MAAVIARRADHRRHRPRRGGTVPIPVSGAARSELMEPTTKVAATLRVNGAHYPVELDPHVSLLDACATSSASRVRRRGATTPSAAPA